MNSFKAKLGIGIMVLLAAFGASQVMYWRNVEVLHDYLSSALSLSEEMHNVEAFHSSIHSMLITVRFSVNNNRGIDRDQYALYKSEAKGALERLKQYNVKMSNKVVYKGIPCLLATNELLDAVTGRFASFQNSLDAVALGKSSAPDRSLTQANMDFDEIFNNFYLELLKHYDMETDKMRESARQVKVMTRVYFTAQLIFALLVGSAVLFYLENVVLKIHAVTERYAFTDPLTSLSNRRYLDKYLHDEIGRSARYKRPFALAMIDIDNFKIFNDTYGHPAGDKLLKDIASIMQRSVRKTDVVARYGGEEFTIVLPELDKESAVKVAEKIRTLVASHAFSLPGSEDRPVASISIGLAVFPADGDTADEVIKIADSMLYKAKQEGKNKVMA